ncbi:hypothetical protein T02_11015 [Trichinella nativa]|uniref:Uncharacterized protein n=1 Tax=Trichinella nativa TaxID=6335 RepID=A0A0V1KNC2_9BILA|nr:hypothetical protein T02_11015 [Trichinella nativa]
MKYSKNKLRNRLTDVHLNNVLYLASPSLSLNMERLWRGTQHQILHEVVSTTSNYKFHMNAACGPLVSMASGSCLEECYTS